MSGVLAALALTAGMAVSTSSAAASQPPEGFKAPLVAEGLAEPTAPECSLSRGTLSCRIYSVPPSGGSHCSFGGSVTEIRLGASAAARRGVVCVDEGFHDWGVLSAGHAWRRSGFACAHSSSGSGLGLVGRLVCSNAAGYRFSIDGLARVAIPSRPQRAWLALGDSYASGEGIPGADSSQTAQGRDCERASGSGTNARAWSVGAYDEVGAKFGFGRIAFVACTGAITDEIKSQIEEARSSSDAGNWDTVTLGVGGNNLRFVDVLKGCLDVPKHWGDFDLTPGCDQSSSQLRARVDMLTGKRGVVKGEYAGNVTLPQVLDRVSGVVKPGGDVVVTGYPQLVEEVGRWDLWRRTVFRTCEGIPSKDVGMLRGVTGYLNEQIALAVHAADARHGREGVRFHFVDIAKDPYEYSDDPAARHALCSRTPWLNGVTTGISSGDIRIDRSFHPMQVGHTNTARVVAALMRDEVRFDDAPDTPPLAAGPNQSHPTSGTLLNYGDGSVRYKPSALANAGSGIGCGVWKARALRWQSWTADQATATGTLIYNPGRPNCARAKLRSTPATFRFFRPRQDCPLFRGNATVREPRTVFTRADVQAAARAIQKPWHTSPADGFQCR